MTDTRFEFTTRARPLMEIGIGSTVTALAPTLWDVALWDAETSVWNGDEPLWVDVSCDVEDAVLDAGRGRVTDSFPVGTAEITINNTSGWADPSTDFEADYGTGYMPLRPGRMIRIGVEHVTLGTCWLWRGFIDEIIPVDDPDDWSTVRLSCIDALGEVGRGRMVEEFESGDGELAHARVTRILDAMMWPQTKRDVSTSAIRELFAAELDGQAVDLLRQTADSEGGWLFADINGNIVFHHRDWLFYEIGDPPDGYIGNVGVLADFMDIALESGFILLTEADDLFVTEVVPTLLDPWVCPSGWERSFARGDITTQVVLDRAWPSGVDSTGVVVLNDPLAQRLYGLETLERRDLWSMDDVDVWQIAFRLMATRSASESMPRIRNVTLDASTSDAALDLLCTLSIWTPTRVRGRLETDRGLVFDDQFFAVGVTHKLSSDSWVAEVSLDRASMFELLDPVDYVWDTARFDHSLWS